MNFRHLLLACRAVVRRRRVLVLALVLVLGSLAFLLLSRSPPEPVYDGKPLSYWVNIVNQPPSLKYSGNVAPHPEYDQAAVALRHIGTNALPQLLDMTGAHDSPLKRSLILLLRKQSLIKFNLQTSDERVRQALEGFRVLGPIAEPAIPVLIARFKNPNLLYSNENPAYVAASILGDGIGEPARVPLLNALTNDDPNVRYHACFTLGWFNSIRSADSIPALLLRLDDTNLFVRCRALVALGHIRREPETVVPALTRGLGDKESAIRYNAAWAIGEFGPLAEAAIPALANAWHAESSIAPRPAGRGGLLEPKSAEQVRQIISTAGNLINATAFAQALAKTPPMITNTTGAK